MQQRVHKSKQYESADDLEERNATEVNAFFDRLAMANGFRREQLESGWCQTRISVALPHFTAQLFGIQNTEVLATASILSAAVDGYVRAVDELTDNPGQSNAANRLHFFTLALLSSASLAQSHVKIDLLKTLFSCLSAASRAERSLLSRKNSSDWSSSSAIFDMGQKNYALFVVPEFLANFAKDRWPMHECQEFFATIFTHVQHIDDIIDLEEDRAAKRYNYFQYIIDKPKPKNIKQCTAYIDIARNQLMESLASIKDILRHPRIPLHLRASSDAELEKAIQAIKIIEASEYSTFVTLAAATLPPIVAYGG